MDEKTKKITTKHKTQTPSNAPHKRQRQGQDSPRRRRETRSGGRHVAKEAQKGGGVDRPPENGSQKGPLSLSRRCEGLHGEWGDSESVFSSPLSNSLELFPSLSLLASWTDRKQTTFRVDGDGDDEKIGTRLFLSPFSQTRGSR